MRPTIPDEDVHLIDEAKYTGFMIPLPLLFPFRDPILNDEILKCQLRPPFKSIRPYAGENVKR